MELNTWGVAFGMGALGILVVGALGNIIGLTASNSYYANIIVGMLLLSAVYLEIL